MSRPLPPRRADSPASQAIQPRRTQPQRGLEISDGFEGGAGTRRQALQVDSTELGPIVAEVLRRLEQGDTRGAVAALAKRPEVAAEVAREVAQYLPRGFLEGLLTNGPLVRALLKDKQLHEALARVLASPTDVEALRRLLRHERFRTGIVSALAREPRVQALLTRLGLTSTELVRASAAAVPLLEAASHLQAGQWVSALEACAQAVQLVPKLEALLRKRLEDTLPPQLKQALDVVGVDLGDLLLEPRQLRAVLEAAQQLSAAGPLTSQKILDALAAVVPQDVLDGFTDFAQAVAAGDWGAALSELAQLARAHPRVVTRAAQVVSDQLPRGFAKAALADDTLLRALLLDSRLHQAFGTLLKNPLDTAALKVVLGHDQLVTRTLTALVQEPRVKALLRRFGLSAQSLINAGDAAVPLLETGVHLSRAEWPEALESLQEALAVDADLTRRLVDEAQAALPDAINQLLTSAGLTLHDFVGEPGAARPLFAALEAFSERRWGEGIRALSKLATSAPTVTDAVLEGLAKQLPPGAGRTLLSDLSFMQRVFGDVKLQEAFAQLLSEKERLEGARALVADTKLRRAVFTALAKDPLVEPLLTRLGITDLNAAGRAAPALLEVAVAVQAQDWGKALRHLVAARAAAPQQADAMLERLEDMLPPGLRDVLSAAGLELADFAGEPEAVELVLGLHTALRERRWPEALEALGGLTQTSPQVTRAVLDALARQLPPGAVRTLLTDRRFIGALLRDGRVRAGLIELFDDARRAETMEELLLHDDLRTSVVAALVTEPAVKALLSRYGLKGRDLQEAAAAAPYVLKALRLADEDLGKALQQLAKAALEAPGLTNRLAQQLLARLPPQVKRAVDALGMTPHELLSIADALPALLSSAQAAGRGDFRQAWDRLWAAAQAAPRGLPEKALNVVGASIPETPATSIARTLLMDPTVVSVALRDQRVHEAVRALLAGHVEEGLEGLLLHDGVRTPLLRALSKNAQFMRAMQRLGIGDAATLLAAGRGVADLVRVVNRIEQGDWPGAFEALGRGFQRVSPALRTKLIAQVARRLRLPPSAAQLLLTSASVLGSPDVAKAMGKALTAMSRGDVRATISGLGEAVRAIAVESPGTAELVLGVLAQTPGTFGRLFSDRQLNAALVRSGSLGHLFAAAEAVAMGDFQGAIRRLSHASTSLLSEPPPYRVFGRDMPIGPKGVESYTRLFARFVDALPPKVRAKVLAEATRLAARAGLRTVPAIGTIVSGVSALFSGWNLIESWNDPSTDRVDLALNVADFVLDLGGMVPAAAAMTGPLQIVIGAARTLKAGVEVYQSLEELQQAFMTLTPGPLLSPA